ncbi:hypothetical protein AVEN_269551-1 [Araneus ventricosus]|uniref:Uncharacterized protein n=1 Tax=Araneus ventricosus TaxID=182803 RepID=A0A4Y2CCI1_ARAVE|nr:hypothetical protein AVEN_269551-1 [Araneus ventricosus]
MRKLEVVGCDGTVTNTGWKNSIIHRIENHVGQSLQCSICILHFNELPFHHIFQDIGGQTAGPKSFSGQIEQQLTFYEKLLVVDYEAIDCSIPDINRNLLKTNNICWTFQMQSPWDIVQKTWQIGSWTFVPFQMASAANRVLRLYISSSDPSGNLKEIVGFILKSYIPVWFAIKKSKYFTDGLKHVFQAIQTSRHLPDELFQVVDPVIQRNAFFEHTENILLTMLVNEREHILELGYRRILKARQIVPKKKTVRNFVSPKINF